MARDGNGKWINPKSLSYRERMDRYLESQGLLNYQTKGMSADQIAQGYQNAGVSVQSNWSKQNYGVDVNEIRNPQVPIQITPTLPQNGGGSSVQSRTGLVGGGASSEQGKTTNGNISYVTLPNGLVVKTPGAPQYSAEQTAAMNIRPQEEVVSVQQALNGEINWEDLPVANRKVLLSDPSFYEGGAITKYPAWMQQQILADPSFDWDKLPKWQKYYYQLSSSPAGMGAVQGATLGLIGGPVGSLAGAGIGSALGYAAGKSGYDATKEFWEQENTVSSGFGLLNWLVEQVEKTAGMGFQIANAAGDPNKAVSDVLNKESWNAGASFFEVITPAFIEAMNEGKGEIGWDDLVKTAPAIYVVAKIGQLILHPEKYKGEESFLGSESPIQLDESWIERIDQAREEIRGGRPYREVMMEMQTSVTAQLGDMAGQALADPLNVMPNMTTRAGAKIAELGGNTVAKTALEQSGGLSEAARRYRTLVQTGQALTIDPNFKVDQMGRFSRFVAGINEQGQVKTGSLLPTQKGLLDPITQRPKDAGFKRNLAGAIEDLSTQTPHSRAQTGAGMFYENVSALLQRFDDPHEAGIYLRALANNDMDTWSKLGSRFADSPEFYTVLPALKEFKTKELDGIIQAWDMTTGNRDLLTRISNVLGDQPGTVLDDLAKRGTAEQDFARVTKKLQESKVPEAKALLAEIEAGKFTSETLAQMVDAFTGEGALPWHPGQWKAQMLVKMSDYFDQWVTQRLMLDKSPEAVSAFFRTSALMKQAQSILLLGGSPGYAITNGLSNMAHRAFTGIYGYMSSGQIDSFMNRLGITPARFEEGVGIGGVVESASTKSGVVTSAMDTAIRGKGALTNTKDVLTKISKGMPFSKLSAMFERMEGKQAFVIGMKQFWNSSWRRGVGFRTMSPELVNVIRQMGVDPNKIYAAIEAGMNQAEIEKALTGRQTEVQARSLIHNAAQKAGMSVSEAARMLDEIGVLDTLDQFLKGQTTRDGVQGAFRRAEQVSQDWIDMQTGEDLKAIAESVKQRVGLEGATAALDVTQKAQSVYTDAWLDHYYRFGEVMSDLNLLDDPAQRSKAIDYNYTVSDKEFRRISTRSAANYQGIFEAWGLSGNASALKVLEGIGEADTAMSNAYRQMREIRKGFFEKYRNDWDNPKKWDEWNANQSTIERLFDNGFKSKHDAEVKTGAALAEIYEGMYGPAAGEAARLWWDDVVKFNDEIVKREREFRNSLEGLTSEERAVLKQEYYSKTKLGLIAEVEKINGEGIARLERVIKKGGSGGVTSPKSPNPAPDVDGGRLTVDGDPTPSPSHKGEGSSAVDEVNALMAAAEQRKSQEARVSAERVASVWDVAEEYWGRGGNYSREIFQDRFALLNALRKAEYGGITDLFDLSDARLTPEIVRQVMENRKVVKEGEANAAAQNALTPDPSPRTGEGGKRKFDVTQINEDTSILRAIALHGGLNMEARVNITGEKKVRGLPGLFTKKGLGLDEMARMLVDDGYAIDLNNPMDAGGIAQTVELINRARTGQPVYPKGHDFNADLLAAERAYIESFDFENVPEVDPTLWQAQFMDTIQQGDLTKMWGMIGDYPESFDPNLLTEYVNLADETAVRVESELRDTAVAEDYAQAQESIREAEVHAEAVTKRNLLIESFQEQFKLTETQARGYGELSDALAEWYARVTGESADEFYSRYYEETVEGQRAESREQLSVDSGRLEQDEPRLSANFIDKAKRANSFEEWMDSTPDYMSVDGATIEGVFDPNTRKDLTLREIYELRNSNPKHKVSAKFWTAKRGGVARRKINISKIDFPQDPMSFYEGLRTNPTPDPSPNATNAFREGSVKGAVTFGVDGIKATIHAFEAADFSTLIHENGHVFRRVLKDVVERTGNQSIKADLDVIEQWAGVKDEVWTREAEEMFARGFERYITEGKAPTPKLKVAFENFKKFMLEIYKTITGSAIDVKLSDDVRRVFDRMLGAENYRIDLENQLLQMNYDPKKFYVDPTGNIVPRPEFKIEIDTSQLVEDVAGLDIEGMRARVEALRARTVDGGQLTVDSGLYEEGWQTKQAWGDIEDPRKNARVKELTQWTLGEMKKNGEQRAVETLFQRAEPTESPAFNEWFGESKVVDESGKPLVVYHGTAVAGFEQFKGDLFYFTADRNMANNYAGSKSESALPKGKDYWDTAEAKAVYPVYLKIETPFDTRLPEVRKIFMDEFYNKYGNGTPLDSERGLPDWTDAEALKEFITERNLPYDGLILAESHGGITQAVFDSTQVKSVNNRGTWDASDPNILFQEANQPFGAYDSASQWHAHSEVMDEGWSQKVRPLLKEMEAEAVNQLGGWQLNGMDADGTKMLQGYMKQVQNEMATSKLATVRFAEKQRDQALLNYNKRYGIDRVTEFGYPYAFYPTRSLFTWGGRGVDKPAIFSHYARIQMQEDRYERDIPERLRGKIQIPAPWLPEWIGDSLFIDPVTNLFFPANLIRPFERAQQEKDYQVIEAERILQEWQADGEYSDAEIISAAQSQEGKVWERAFEEAKLRRESELANPMDFFSTMMGPAWYLTTPMNLMGISMFPNQGKPEDISMTPLGNTSRAIDTVTQDTWAEPVGDLFGLIGKAEEWGRDQLGLPTRGEYAEYYAKRQISNMVAEGLVTAEQGHLAMIEQQGQIWDDAVKRVDLELALRVPLAGVTYAVLQEGTMAGLQALAPSLFGAGILPEGELEFRGLKQEWNEAWAKADAGDETAVSDFFEAYPEYEAYLAKGKDDEELLRSFLVGQIWDQYMELGATNQRLARAEMGELFNQAFLDKETRSYDSLDVNQLTEWVQMLGGLVPKTTPPPTPPQMEGQFGEGSQQLKLYPEDVTGVTDSYFRQRTQDYPNWFEEQQGYYALPKSERKEYLVEHPNLAAYWKWKDSWFKAYPQYKHILNGQAFKRVDTSGWMPGLAEVVQTAAFTGGNLPSGARAALMNVWLMEGQPMGDFETWVKSVVMPAMIYQ